ncbi:hypothetical protein Tco_0076746, partial [Tanacetum coccineum]
GGRGVKEKNKDSDNVAAKDVVVPPVVDEPVVTVFGNSSGTQDGNVVSSTATLVDGRKSMKFRTLITPAGNGTDVAVPLESIRAISKRFNNTAYGFFLGKRVAYPVVANYVRNTWVKHGLVKLMLNSSTGLFLFQFSSMDEDVVYVSVWVKLHGILVTAFGEDGLSAIAIKLDTPLMLDSYTSLMCMQS